MSDDLSFKIITIGDSGVGKTAIIKRYVYNCFDSGNLSTIGVNFSFKDIILKNNKRIKLKLIDTAGQEKYRSLSKSYFKNADGVLFVFSLNDLQSFQNLTDWINLFKENTINNKRIPIYLIGNKDDLEHKVDKKLIDELLQEYNGYEYRSVNALNDNNIRIRISELFQEMAEKLFNNYKDVEKNQYIWKK